MRNATRARLQNVRPRFLEAFVRRVGAKHTGREAQKSESETWWLLGAVAYEWQRCVCARIIDLPLHNTYSSHTQAPRCAACWGWVTRRVSSHGLQLEAQPTCSGDGLLSLSEHTVCCDYTMQALSFVCGHDTRSSDVHQRFFAAALPLPCCFGGASTAACDSKLSITFHTTAQVLTAATVSLGGTNRKLKNWKGTQRYQLVTTTLAQSCCSFACTAPTPLSAVVSLHARARIEHEWISRQARGAG